MEVRSDEAGQGDEQLSACLLFVFESVGLGRVGSTQPCRACKVAGSQSVVEEANVFTICYGVTVDKRFPFFF